MFMVEKGSQLWVVGRATAKDGWSLQGIFMREADAIEACRDELYFIGPAELNVSLPHENRWWPGCYYPKAETKEQAAARAAKLGAPSA
jgi:hypothetical protein